jgi:hypothetical protein
VLATLRTIHANPKAAGVRNGFYDPYSNDGHDEGLAGDGLSEGHPPVPTGAGGGPTAGLAARGRAFQTCEWKQAKTHRAKTRGLRGAMGSEPNQPAMSGGQKKSTGV